MRRSGCWRLLCCCTCCSCSRQLFGLCWLGLGLCFGFTFGWGLGSGAPLPGPHPYAHPHNHQHQHSHSHSNPLPLPQPHTQHSNPLPLPQPHSKYSTRVVKTSYGALRGVILQTHSHTLPQVEAYLGVPYASAPTGSLRYMPPITPSRWKGTRVADSFGPVCPQRFPDVSNRTEALLRMPLARYLHLKRLQPMLINQSEDCLYLNLYVPKTAGSSEDIPPHSQFATMVIVHGESFEWSSGNPYDGSVLASYSNVIVVTLNFRLGSLGFLKTGSPSSSQGNYGLMDLVAALHWLRQNLPAFGGDPERLTLIGHTTGAALVNFLVLSPVAKDLFQRVILLSGSSLSPWALQRQPLAIKRKVGEQMTCAEDALDDDLANCLRDKPLGALLHVKVPAPRFLSTFAPIVDGMVIKADPLHEMEVGSEGGFQTVQMLLCATTTESFFDLSAQDVDDGFSEAKQDRILRTYVRNTYYYHLNEIFSTLKNEYTDWETPQRRPVDVRDATLEVLSDGHTVAPLVRTGFLHASRGAPTYFCHFQYHAGGDSYPQQDLGSVRGEDVPYVLGLPLADGEGGSSSPSSSSPDSFRNFSLLDRQIAENTLRYFTNFAKTGDPNKDNPRTPSLHSDKATSLPFWDTYDPINQLYMEIGPNMKMKSHYRGHKMAVWLNLIPQLHRPGGDDVSMRHHNFQEEDEEFYEGMIRPQSLKKPPAPLVPISTTEMPSFRPTALPPPPTSPPVAASITTTECPPNGTLGPAASNSVPALQPTAHFHSYTTALSVTIAVGCFLLLLNILIFAGIYHQRDKRQGQQRQQQPQQQQLSGSATAPGLSGCGSGTGSGNGSDDDDGFALEQRMVKAGELLLEAKVKSSCSLEGLGRMHSSGSFPLADLSPTVLKRCGNYAGPPPSYSVAVPLHYHQKSHHYHLNPGIPEPPPPPKSLPPSQLTSAGSSVSVASLASGSGGSTTPGTASTIGGACASGSGGGAGILRREGSSSAMKKRVQIQEISV